METVNSLRLLELTVNRTDFLDFEQSAGPARRSVTGKMEFRTSASGDTLTYRGYASTTETEYPVYGGTFPGWIETMARGSFNKTLRENADVSFLINHDGMALARTKAGTLKLTEDKTGLLAEARLNANVSAVRDLYELSRDGNMDEMSFGFRVTRDRWLNGDGEEVDQSVGTHRRILEVNMNKGDVSAVNYGANETTSGGFRAMAELRDGRLPVDDELKRLAEIVLEERMVAPGSMMLEHIQAIETAAANLRDLLNSNDVSKTPAQTSEELLLQNSFMSVNEARVAAAEIWPEPDPLISAYRALHELMRDPAA